MFSAAAQRKAERSVQVRARRSSTEVGDHRRAGLTAERLVAAAKTMAVDRVTGEVVAAFEAAGIPTILLKGPSIARWLYPDGGRTYTDTDLLVPAAAYARAPGILTAIGFVDRFEGFHPMERRAFPTVANSYVRPSHWGDGRGGDVDLHRNLPGLPTPDEQLWEAFSGATETLPVGGRPVRVLNRTGVALHVVVHAVRNGFRLHTDEDLRRAIEAMSVEDWEPVAALAGRLGIADVLGFGLRHHAAGATVADRLGLPPLVIADSPYRQALLGGPRGAGSLVAFREARTWPERASRIRWAMLPSPAKVRYSLDLPGATGPRLALGYLRWWQDLARAAVPAVRHAVRTTSGQSSEVARVPSNAAAAGRRGWRTFGATGPGSSTSRSTVRP